MTLRQIFRVHSWAGLAGALVLVVMGISGSILVFGEEIDRALFPRLHEVSASGERADIDTIVARALARHPGWALVRVRHLPQTPADTTVLELADQRDSRLFVYANPHDGAILGARSFTVRELVLRLHTTLLAGRGGAVLVAAVSVLLALAVVTGAILHWRHLFRIPRGKMGYRWVHELVGGFSLLLNTVWAVTGVLLAYPGLTSRPRISHDAPIARALTVAERELRPLGARPTEAGVRVYGGGAAVLVDPRSGEVLQRERASWLKASLHPLHTGSFGGPALKVLYVLFGLSAPALSITGIAMWSRRLRRSERKSVVAFSSQRSLES